MRLPLLFLTVAIPAVPAPALAQHAGHGAPVEQASSTAGAAHAESSAAHGSDHSDHAPRPAQVDAVETHPDSHAGHAQTREVEAAPMPAVDAHAAHAALSEGVRDPQAAHRADDLVPPPVGGPPPEALDGPEHAADVYFGGAAMARARHDLGRMHGATPVHRVLVDRLEARLHDRGDTYLFDAQAWYGGDIDKFWVKAEGEGAFEGGFEGVELQALWSRAITPWFDLQTGVRYDLRDGPDRTHLVLGVQGLAPYWIEVEAAVFLSDRGDLTVRMEAEHDMRITRKLILQPRMELEVSAQDVPVQTIGSGLASAVIGARLRYQFTPLLGPYIGVEYDRAFGDTRILRAAANQDPGAVRFLAGIRTWF